MRLWYIRIKKLIQNIYFQSDFSLFYYSASSFLCAFLCALFSAEELSFALINSSPSLTKLSNTPVMSKIPPVKSKICQIIQLKFQRAIATKSPPIIVVMRVSMLACARHFPTPRAIFFVSLLVLSSFSPSSELTSEILFVISSTFCPSVFSCWVMSRIDKQIKDSKIWLAILSQIWIYPFYLFF